MSVATANASRWRGQKGHYEAWHLRAADPSGAAGAWIRMGFHVPAEEAPGEPLAEVWFVGRDDLGAGYARSQTFALDSFQTGAGGFPVQLGSCRLEEGAASGALDEARWELRWQRRGEALDYGGESRLRRSEAVTSQPVISVSGSLAIGDRRIELAGWPGHQLHAWGARHAERWARLHCASLDVPGDFVEVSTRRIAGPGGLAAPVTLGAARLTGVEFSAGDSARGLASRARFAPDRYEFTVRGVRARLTGLVRCDPADLIGVTHHDPDGGRVFAYQTDRAGLKARLERRTARGWRTAAELTADRVAYEFAERAPVPGIEVVL